MMKSFTTRLVLLFLVSFFALQTVNLIAGESSTTFKFGLNERLRHSYMNNNMDFNADTDDEQGFFRIKTNLWGELGLGKNFTARVAVTNEFRPYTIVRKSDETKDMTFDEIFFENLYLKYTTSSQNPLTFILGRQNLIYGEGFILLDGAPWDGSRSIYHDAIKISLKRGDLIADILGISNPVYDDRLPKIAFFEEDGAYLGLPKKHGDQLLNDGLEQAVGLYLTRKPAKGTSLEGYYFMKTEEPELALPAFAGITPDQLEKLTVHTVGGRVVHPFNEKLALSAEGAYQMGGQGDNSIGAYGGYANLAYTLVPQKKGIATVGINILSGDDPATGDIEGWNPLFSRWPKWSELYIYSQTAENNGGGRKIAYWSNTLSPNLKLVIDLHPKVNLTVWAHHLRAFHPTASGDGKTRGNELQLWLKFNINKYFTGHFLYDYFMPGDFYATEDGAQFIRGEIMYNFAR
jgi:hypothetical protein